MARSRKGSGSVFQRTDRDSKGKLRKTTNWYIEFVAGNKTLRESTDFTKRSDAAEFLKKRISDATAGKIVLSRNVTFDDLRSLIIVDYENNRRIDAGEAKDATAGREFQFTTWMRDALERQRKFVSKVEKRTKAVIPWVFCRPDGVRIHRFYEPWQAACKAAGIQRIPHDFRRTAVRNLERAGVPRTTAMAMIGHKTESIYRRYSFVDQGMLEMGTAKLEALQQVQLEQKSNLTAFGRKRRTATS